jgi:hypothetical protein
LDQQDRKELRVFKDCRVIKELKVFKELRVFKDCRVIKELKVFKELRVSKVFKVK